MTTRKFYTFRVNDATPNDHIGRLGEITYRDGFLYYHDGATAGGEVIGGGGSGGGSASWASVTGKPSFATVATSGSYADLTGKPTIVETNQTLNTSDSVSFNRLTVTGASGIEGGEIQLAKAPNSTLAGDVIIDVYENKLRFFEGGGTGRGFYLDLTTGANNTSTNIMSGGSGGAQGAAGADGAPGADGAQGEPGAAGADGAPGQGVPTGGTVGQVLAKIDSTDYNTEWVDQTSGGPTNEITNTNAAGTTYSVSVGTDGVVTMTTSRGGLEFGALPEPGGPTHFHIMRPAGESGSGGTDLYFGDDYNYVLQRPASYNDSPAYGVEIGANDNDGGAQQVWRFGTDGVLTLPAGGTIIEGGGLTGAIKLTPAGGANAYQALLIYPTAAVDGDHVHLTAGGGTTELYLGNDLHYVKLVNGGDVEVRATSNLDVSTAAWTFSTDGNLVLPAGGDIKDSTGASVLGGGSANTGNITFSSDYMTGTDGQIRMRTLDVNQTASYSFNPSNSDYSTAVWDGTGITFNDPTQAIYDAIWALTDVSVIEVQVGSTWFTVTWAGSSTPGMPQAPTLFVNESAVGGPLNIDVVDITINQGTESYVEIDGTDFEVDVQDDIRMYANDVFLLSNRSSSDPIRIETNDGSHQWSFNSAGDLILPDGGDIKNDNGNSLLFSGSYNDLSDTPSLFSGDYNDLTNKPTIRIAVATGSGPGGNLQADSLALAGLNPVTDIPSTWGGDLILQGGVGGANGDLYGEVRIKSGQIGANYEWHFTTDKKIKLPAGGNIVDSTGATAFVSLATLKQVVADSTDFADFKSRIAGMS